jgi:hypothetical protein
MEEVRMQTLTALLANGPVAINLGLEEFAAALEDQHVEVIHVDWSPRPVLGKETKDLLDKLL